MDEWRERLATAVALAVAEPSDRSIPHSLSSTGSVPLDPSPPDDSARIRALVELAQHGDTEAFGQLYDRYVTAIFRFVYARVGTFQLAEDITAETFVRALRSLHTFQWRGKDFGAWLTVIARNLMNDHYKSLRTRSEFASDTLPEQPDPGRGPEADMLSSLSNEELMRAVAKLPKDQRDCVLMRFVEELTIAETAQALGRSEGAIKQLQLRAVRSLAKMLRPEDA